jgi:hypothetical protein
MAYYLDKPAPFVVLCGATPVLPYVLLSLTG